VFCLLDIFLYEKQVHIFLHFKYIIPFISIYNPLIMVSDNDELLIALLPLYKLCFFCLISSLAVMHLVFISFYFC
jgi:hypothetical protein